MAYPGQSPESVAYEKERNALENTPIAKGDDVAKLPWHGNGGIKMDNNSEYFKPQNHKYTTHRTYTGKGCAICGRPESEHQQSATTDKTKKAVSGEND